MNHLPLTHPQSKAISRIRHFFDSWSLPSALEEADTIFRKAAGEKAWRPANPYNVVHYCGQLWKLSKAAYALQKDFNSAFETKILAEDGEQGPDLARREHYTGSGLHASPFGHMPRHLDAEEYRLPCKALQRFCQHRTKHYWKNFYRQLLQCALSSVSLEDYEEAGKLFRLRLHVFKLIEACHLIHVRLGNIPVTMAEDAAVAG